MQTQLAHHWAIVFNCEMRNFWPFKILVMAQPLARLEVRKTVSAIHLGIGHQIHFDVFREGHISMNNFSFADRNYAAV